MVILAIGVLIVSENFQDKNFEEIWTSYNEILRDEPKNVVSNFKKYLKAIYDGEEPKIAKERIALPNKEDLVAIKDIDDSVIKLGYNNLNKLAYIKLNGGMSTTLGGTVPKIVIEAKNKFSYFQIIAKQILSINKKYDSNMPLVLMNSFFTEELTKKEIQKNNPGITVKTFIQNKHPRVRKDDLLPLKINGKVSWAAPGHGDFYNALYSSGLLDELLTKGIEYAFVSNVDNLMAIPDAKILGYFMKEKLDFLLEVCEKTLEDVKGGTPTRIDGQLRLLERALVSDEMLNEFEDINHFKVFNTNNLWINLKKMKEVMDKGELNFPFLQNSKNIEGEDCIQIETVIGDGISAFEKTKAIIIPRNRFAPTKKPQDQLSLMSDLFVLDENGFIDFNKERKKELGYKPNFKLTGYLDSLDDLKRFEDPNTLSLVDLEELEITGDVKFGTNVQLKGKVKIINNKEEELVIGDDAVIVDEEIIN